MYESITQIIISTIAAFALLITTIGRTLKNRVDKNETAISETRDSLFKEYATKNDLSDLKNDFNKHIDRMINHLDKRLDKIENKIDRKKDKR